MKVVLVPGLQLKNFSKNVGQLSSILADCSKTAVQTFRTSSFVDSGQTSRACGILSMLFIPTVSQYLQFPESSLLPLTRFSWRAVGYSSDRKRDFMLAARMSSISSGEERNCLPNLLNRPLFSS